MSNGSSPPAPNGDRDDGGALRAIARAIELQERGRLDDAEAVYARLLAKDDRDPTVLINAGVLAVLRDDMGTAVARLARASTLVPGNAVAHGNLGYALIHAGRLAEALAALDRAVLLKPDFVQAHNSRGIALVRMNRRDEAKRAFEQALVLRPTYTEAALNLGELANQDGDPTVARAAFEPVLARDFRHAVSGAGVAFADALEGRLDESIVALERVVEEHPRAAAVWQTLGAVCNWAWRHEAAEIAYREALSIDPRNREARFGVASSLLSRGRYDEGLAAFEASRASFAPASTALQKLPPWSGDQLAGTLVLHAEQGLGDVVQFARFLPRLSDRVQRVVLWLDQYWQPLAPLLASLEGVDEIVTGTERMDAGNPRARCSLLSLAHLAQATPGTAWDGAYLAAPAERIDTWRSRVDATASLRVGLAWSVHARDDHGYVTRHKSVPPETLAPLLDVRGVAFHSLQPGQDGDAAVFGVRASRVVPTGPAIGDFGDTAALIENLDLVITPDTAVAHVAGALGKPVWLLERFHGCWRWRLEAETAPWYPTVRIFRQSRFNDWSDVVTRAAAALATYNHGNSNRA
jgi:Flp pilus assembly protein TadD